MALPACQKDDGVRWVLVGAVPRSLARDVVQSKLPAMEASAQSKSDGVQLAGARGQRVGVHAACRRHMMTRAIRDSGFRKSAILGFIVTGFDGATQWKCKTPPQLISHHHRNRGSTISRLNVV